MLSLLLTGQTCQRVELIAQLQAQIYKLEVFCKAILKITVALNKHDC
jgi:hypothetical protein